MGEKRACPALRVQRLIMERTGCLIPIEDIDKAIWEPTLVKHEKTGRLYDCLSVAINCTNQQDGQSMVLYRQHDPCAPDFYVREVQEFSEKFDFAKGAV